MTAKPGTPLAEMHPRDRRLLIARALLHAGLTTTILVTLYYVLPFDTLSKAGSAFFLAIGLVGVIVIIAWEVRNILHARYPGVQAIGALALSIPLFLLLFSTAYYLIERTTPASFGQPLTRTDALYFTVTTFATVGYGDITAKTTAARIVVIFQMLSDLVILGFGVKVVFGAVQMGRRRRDSTAQVTSGPDSVVDSDRGSS